jgi:hypothetical protein
MIKQAKIRMLAAAAALLIAPASQAALSSYTQDFEAIAVATNPSNSALGTAGFLVSGVVYNGDTGANPPYGAFKFFYGNFPAPNDASGAPAFSAVITGESGPGQGLNVLNVFSDYKCCQSTNEGHFDGTAPYDFVQSNFFREQTIGPADIGTVWSFKFDGKMSAVNGCGTNLASDCVAFIRTLDPNLGFAQTNFVTFDAQANLTSSWSTHNISIDLSDPLLSGQVLQFGFQSTSQLFGNTGVYYDNIYFGVDTDEDGVPNIADNCRLVANNSGTGAQADSDGDGYGNRCDGDLNQNLVTNAQDYVLFRQQIGQPSVAPVFNKADINANGVVNAQDYVIFRGLIGSAPGPGAGP